MFPHSSNFGNSVSCMFTLKRILGCTTVFLGCTTVYTNSMNPVTERYFISQNGIQSQNQKIQARLTRLIVTWYTKILVLSTELIMQIGHRTEILKADVLSVSPSSERIQQFL